MKPQVLLIVVLFWTFQFGESHAQQSKSLMLDPEFIADAQYALNLSYNREYASSVRYMSDWRKEHPNNPLWAFWPVLNSWWAIIADLQNHEFDPAFIRIIEQSIKTSDAVLSSDPNNVDALIVKSISLAYLSRLQSNREQWLRSFRNARRSLNLVSEIEKIAPDHPDIDFGNGMVLYFAAFLRDEYPAARAFGFLLPRGDRQKGLEILDKVSREGVFFGPESVYFLGHIYLHYERDYDTALSYLKTLTERYPDNPYYGRLLSRTYFRNFRFSEAMYVIDDYLERLDTNTNQEHRTMREELHYIMGRIHQQQEDHDEAISQYELAIYESGYLHNSKKREFRLMAAYHKGESHLQLKETDEAKQAFEFVATSKTDFHYVQRARDALKNF